MSTLLKPVLLSTTLLFFGSQLVYLLPHALIGATPFGRASFRAASSLLTVLGMTDRWNMFAPQPRCLNLDTEALVTFADGSQKVFLLSDLDRACIYDSADAADAMKVPGWHRFKNEKWRKLLIERLPCQGSQPYLEDVACFIGRQFACGSAEPVNVELYCRYGEIPKADSAHWSRPSRHPALLKCHQLINYPLMSRSTSQFSLRGRPGS